VADKQEIDVNKLFPNRRTPKVPIGVIQTSEIDPADIDPLEQARAFVATQGFRPTEFVDLPGAQPVESPSQPDVTEPIEVAEDVNRKMEQPLLQPGMPPIVKAPQNMQQPIVKTPAKMTKAEEEFVAAFGKNKKEPISNVTEDMIKARYIVTRSGQFPYTEEIADAGLDPEFTRLDNLSGVLPYRNLPQFKHGIFLREPNLKDAAAMAKAFAAQSYTLKFDIFGKLVNVPYRRLTIADHFQIMYNILLISYPAQPIKGVSWTSKLYGVRSEKQTAFNFHIHEKVFDMDVETWKHYEDQALTIPRVYDLEHFDVIKDDEDRYLLSMAQYIDPEHPKLRPYIKSASDKGATSPRLQGRLDYIGEQKWRFRAELEKFIELVGAFGVDEKVELTANVKNMTIGQAVFFLKQLDERDDEQEAELARLESLLPAPDEIAKWKSRFFELDDIASRTEEQEAEYRKLKEGMPEDQPFKPAMEHVAFTRNIWTFYPFL
jgi:hypothetical protein